VFTIGIWEEFIYDYKSIYYSNRSIAQKLLFIIVLTPLFILSDIVLLPIEIIYLITLKIINKKRDDK
jgi:hypothetical protein